MKTYLWLRIVFSIFFSYKFIPFENKCFPRLGKRMFPKVHNDLNGAEHETADSLSPSAVKDDDFARAQELRLQRRGARIDRTGEPSFRAVFAACQQRIACGSGSRRWPQTRATFSKRCQSADAHSLPCRLPRDILSRQVDHLQRGPSREDRGVWCRGCHNEPSKSFAVQSRRQEMPAHSHDSRAVSRPAEEALRLGWVRYGS